MINCKNSFIGLSQQQKHTCKNELARSLRLTQAYKKRIKCRFEIKIDSKLQDIASLKHFNDLIWTLLLRK